MGVIKSMFAQITIWEDTLNKSILSRESKGILQLYGGSLKDSLHEKLLQDKDRLRKYLYDISMTSVQQIKKGI